MPVSNWTYFFFLQFSCFCIKWLPITNLPFPRLRTALNGPSIFFNSICLLGFLFAAIVFSTWCTVIISALLILLVDVSSTFFCPSPLLYHPSSFYFSLFDLFFSCLIPAHLVSKLNFFPMISASSALDSPFFLSFSQVLRLTWYIIKAVDAWLIKSKLPLAGWD